MSATPQIAAVAAVMDEIDQCRNPEPCDLCQRRMQSILDMGAAAERERILRLAGQHHAQYPAEMSGTGIPVRWGWFADLLAETP